MHLSEVHHTQAQKWKWAVGFGCDDRPAVQIVMPWISTAPSFTGVLISLAHLAICRRADESPIGWKEEGVRPIGAGCLGMLQGLVLISSPSSYRDVHGIWRRMREPAESEAGRSGNGWEWLKKCGRESRFGEKKAWHKWALLWICRERISDIWTLDLGKWLIWQPQTPACSSAHHMQAWVVKIKPGGWGGRGLTLVIRSSVALRVLKG